MPPVDRSRLLRLLFAACVCVCLDQHPAGQTPPQYEVVILNGQIADGTGTPLRRADIGIVKGRISTIGTIGANGAAGADVIDATGLIVAPGFIDVHTHADDIAEHPRAENFARMGVTTIVAGNCGSSALDVAKATTEIEHVGTSVNVATLIGHNTVRRAVMGGGPRHVATEEGDPARADRQRARDEIEQRGLPRAVGADERAALSRLHLEGNAIHSAQTAEVLGHPLQPQRQHESSLALTELASPHPSPPEGERAG